MNKLKHLGCVLVDVCLFLIRCFFYFLGFGAILGLIVEPGFFDDISFLFGSCVTWTVIDLVERCFNYFKQKKYLPKDEDLTADHTSSKEVPGDE